jgi:hypothetical protein
VAEVVERLPSQHKAYGSNPSSSKKKKNLRGKGIEVRTYNPNIQEAEAGDCKIKVSLGYIASSKPTWVI